LIRFKLFFLFAFVFLELFYVQYFLVYFINSPSNWCKMTILKTTSILLFLSLLFCMMHLISSLIWLFISMELTSKFNLCFNHSISLDIHRISQTQANLIDTTLFSIIFILFIWPYNTRVEPLILIIKNKQVNAILLLFKVLIIVVCDIFIQNVNHHF
jgi:hypothetical protein